MKPIIEPVDRKLIEKELTEERFLRKTNNGGNMLYIVNAHNSPNVMREIGRLRELSFRDSGGGTGNEVDIDELDLAEGGYEQLIVWDPADKEIVGGYRFTVSRDSYPKYMSMEHYFRFSDKFREKYLPYTIELGRSFVQPKYQGGRENVKGLYSLDNLWDGLGSIIMLNPDIKYFLGKVTMYGNYQNDARTMLVYFLKQYFPDRENLVEPIYPVALHIDYNKMAEIFVGGSYAADYKILTREIRKFGENIPPLINSYMSLSPSMKVFGTALNRDFGDVEETGILITIKDIYAAKTDRHFKCKE